MRERNGDRRESALSRHSLRRDHLCPLLDAYTLCLKVVTCIRNFPGGVKRRIKPLAALYGSNLPARWRLRREMSMIV